MRVGLPNIHFIIIYYLLLTDYYIQMCYCMLYSYCTVVEFHNIVNNERMDAIEIKSSSFTVPTYKMYSRTNLISDIKTRVYGSRSGQSVARAPQCARRLVSWHVSRGTPCAFCFHPRFSARDHWSACSLIA